MLRHKSSSKSIIGVLFPTSPLVPPIMWIFMTSQKTLFSVSSKFKVDFNISYKSLALWHWTNVIIIAGVIATIDEASRWKHYFLQGSEGIWHLNALIYNLRRDIGHCTQSFITTVPHLWHKIIGYFYWILICWCLNFSSNNFHFMR